ncbi:Centromere protein Cenp-O [Penicillium concentricum]|uniref:Centromere protein Cenp-O n=1 Tax=Penicillium concentricum TaxID=293559 RepID=A0A9W9V8D9_9EURO|nr:Centromere protein Cenp-O [Penicillium concentricum]KAJ5372683.1 Centromere protein Cenp-O [Penicillium concentricum]
MTTSTSRVPASPDPEEEELDTEIASIRAEIQNLQKHKRILASSLLTTDPIQKLLRKQPKPTTATPTDPLTTISPLVHAAGAHATSNHHRIAFGATAFPFKDPSPTAPTTPLLGVRIEVCARNGRFAKPYYILLQSERRVPSPSSGSTKMLRVYRHTVPGFISIAKLESVYLPRPGGTRANGDGNTEGGSSADEADPAKPWKNSSRVRKQDLRGFVRELRRELVAWNMRVDAVEFLREKLGLVGEGGGSLPFDVSPDRDTGIVFLAGVSLETRYVRVEWVDGRVGRFKLSNNGVVERAVVIGDEGRDKKIEDAITGGGGRVETVLDRLRVDVLSGSPRA